jgi:hypothetical protein
MPLAIANRKGSVIGAVSDTAVFRGATAMGRIPTRADPLSVQSGPSISSSAKEQPTIDEALSVLIRALAKAAAAEDHRKLYTWTRHQNHS